MPAAKNKASRVWFADIRARGAGENKVSKIEALFKAAGFAKVMRGFKFKVQHPVLGYWRLLKKLHRVS